MAARVGKYLLFETLGEGAFGKVKLGVHEDTGEQVAVKIMDKAAIKASEMTMNVRREIAVMKAVYHPNIVNMRQVLSSSTKLYIVMDLVSGGELFTKILNEGALPEDQARTFFQQLVDGVAYCHSKGICHRDLKPENLLIDENTGELKITDFGLSQMKGASTTDELLHTQCGSPNYCAPEIISRAKQGYNGSKVDVWSCGIILFALLSGYLPFYAEDTKTLFKIIRKEDVQFGKKFPEEPKALVEWMLTKNPDHRPTMTEVKQHPWFLINYKGEKRESSLFLESSSISSLSAKREDRQIQEKEKSNSDEDNGAQNIDKEEQQNANDQEMSDTPSKSVSIRDKDMPSKSDTPLNSVSHGAKNTHSKIVSLSDKVSPPTQVATSPTAKSHVRSPPPSPRSPLRSPRSPVSSKSPKPPLSPKVPSDTSNSPVIIPETALGHGDDDREEPSGTLDDSSYPLSLGASESDNQASETDDERISERADHEHENDPEDAPLPENTGPIIRKPMAARDSIRPVSIFDEVMHDRIQLLVILYQKLFKVDPKQGLHRSRSFARKLDSSGGELSLAILKLLQQSKDVSTLWYVVFKNGFHGERDPEHLVTKHIVDLYELLMEFWLRREKSVEKHYPNVDIDWWEVPLPVSQIDVDNLKKILGALAIEPVQPDPNLTEVVIDESDLSSIGSLRVTSRGGRHRSGSHDLPRYNSKDSAGQPSRGGTSGRRNAIGKLLGLRKVTEWEVGMEVEKCIKEIGTILTLNGADVIRKRNENKLKCKITVINVKEPFLLSVTFSPYPGRTVIDFKRGKNDKSKTDQRYLEDLVSRLQEKFVARNFRNQR